MPEKHPSTAEPKKELPDPPPFEPDSELISYLERGQGDDSEKKGEGGGK
jgi:hypothetical protein